MEKTFKLIPKTIKQSNGTQFTTFELLTKNEEWFRISASKEVREQFEKFSRQYVVCDIDHRFNKKVKGDREDPLLIPTLAINSIRLATPEETAEYMEAVNSRLADDLQNI